MTYKTKEERLIEFQEEIAFWGSSVVRVPTGPDQIREYTLEEVYRRFLKRVKQDINSDQ